MAEKIDCGWLKGYDDKKFLPKTLTTQILNRSGTYLFPDGKENYGSSIHLIYIENGVLKESVGAIGSGINPVYLTNGQITASTSTVGSNIKPVWLNAGTITVSDGNVASNKKLMYLLNGELTASAANVGDTNSPVYLSSGTITVVGTIATDHGGTGASTHTANRLVWSASDTKLQAANHYASSTKIAVNSASAPDYNFYVSGTSGFNGVMTTKDGNFKSTVALNIASAASTAITFKQGDTLVGTFDTDLIVVNDVRMTSSKKGYKLIDSTGTEYYGLVDNGTNLWIGALNSQSGGHTGATYISSGYNTSTLLGNPTVYIAIPNADNTDQNVYSFLHSKNYPDFLDSVYVNASGDTMTGNLTINSTSPRLTIKGETPWMKFTRTNLTRGTTPSANINQTFISYADSTGSAYFNQIAFSWQTSDRNCLRLRAFNAATLGSDTTTYTDLELGYNADFVPFLYCTATLGVFTTMDATFKTVAGAVWNDYAEYRETKEDIKPGYVVVETGLGDLVLSSGRLQPGAEIVSDTFGFSIGETEQSKTPIAVSGRVLAYPYEDRYSYNPGDAVCSAPGGKVSKMTRNEIREYPERIIGTVSEIPEYETWGEDNVQVNGRIWIRIK